MRGIGFFKPLDSGEFVFNQIETQHLIDDFDDTRGVKSNQGMVIYSTDQAVFIWDGKQLQKIDKLNARGSRVFNIKDTLLVSDRQHLYSISLDDGRPLVAKLSWQFPKNVRIKSLFVNQLDQIMMITSMQGVFVLQDNLFVNVISPEQLPINDLSNGLQGADGFYYINSSIDGLMIYSSTFELLRHYKQTDGIGLSTLYSVFQDKQQSIWLGGLPNISVFQPPHLSSQYHSDTGTVGFENIYNIDGDMFFSGTGIYQLKHPFGKTRSPLFMQVPDFNRVVLGMVVIEDEILVATSEGVYLSDWLNNNMSSPRLISSQSFVTRLVYSKEHKYLYATIGNYLSQFEVDLRTIEIGQKVDELNQQQDLKDRFFGNVSHEFRTPLTLAIGPLETLLKERSDLLDPRSKDLTVTALNNAKKMLALVGLVLDISSLDVGKLSLRVAKHDITSLLRDNRDRFMPWVQQIHNI